MPTLELDLAAQKRVAVARARLDTAMCLDDPWMGVVGALDAALPGRGSQLYDWQNDTTVGRIAHSLGGSGWAALGPARGLIPQIVGSPRRSRAPGRLGPTDLSTALLGRAELVARFREEVFTPVGIHDQLRVHLFDRTRFVAWVGAFRAPRDPQWTVVDRAALRALVPDIRATLAAERALRGGTPSRAAIGSVLDALADPALLMTADGFVLFANHVARHRWRELAAAGVVGRPQDIGAAIAHVARVDLEDRSAWLVLPRAAGVTLPPALRDIAALVAEGLSDKEIAARTERPLATVRTYVERIYSRLGVSNRVELARVLAGLPNERGSR